MFLVPVMFYIFNELCVDALMSTYCIRLEGNFYLDVIFRRQASILVHLTDLCHRYASTHLQAGGLLNKTREQQEKTSKNSAANLCYITDVPQSHLNHMS